MRKGINTTEFVVTVIAAGLAVAQQQRKPLWRHRSNELELNEDGYKFILNEFNALKKSNRDINRITIHFWNRRVPGFVTEEDSREMIENITGFFNTLIEWERKANQKKG